MKTTQCFIWVFLSIAVFGLVALQGKTVIPPLNKVTYAGKLSGEPVLVQSFEVNQSSADAVEQAIVNSAKHRGWTVTTPEPGMVKAVLVHRGNDSTLQFKFDAKRVEIHSVSYKINKAGSRLKREEPDGWIRNLHKDVLMALGLFQAK